MNVLLVGGNARRRHVMARAFHDSSPLGDRPFVGLSCRTNEPELVANLRAWLMVGAERTARTGLSVGGGTLYIDHAAAMSPIAQRLLLALASHLADGDAGGATAAAPRRLMVGTSEELWDAVEQGRFAAPLCDALDKIRVGLGPVVRRGAA